METKRINIPTRVRLAQILIAIVVLLNLQCALAFLISPADYAPSFELSGIPGELSTRGVGLLFVMWNIPYLFALTNPLKRYVSLIESMIMQGIGLIGESIFRLNLPAGHVNLSSSLNRFIFFDAGGLVLLLIAWLLVHKQKN
jgi:hypothetical protein